MEPARFLLQRLLRMTVLTQEQFLIIQIIWEATASSIVGQIKDKKSSNTSGISIINGDTGKEIDPSEISQKLRDLLNKIRRDLGGDISGLND